MTSLLAVRNLRVELPLAGSWVAAVDGVSFDLARGERLGIAGESGCGKTLLARALAGLQPESARVSGSVLLDGEELLGRPDREWRRVRGARVGFVFQEPGAALDPVRTIGDQVVEPIRIHGSASARSARARATELLREVAVPDPRRVFREYPHRLSGGQKQRALIASALASDPELLIADEPTTALDATIAAEVMALLERLRQKRSLTLLLISHDLNLLGDHTDRVLVLYAGRVVEEAPTAELLREPRHPYTRGLIRSAPRLSTRGRGARFEPIGGSVPDLSERPGGRCAFLPRCSERFEACEGPEPPLFASESARVRCYLYAKVGSGTARARESL